MSNHVFIGLDLGTSSCKAIAIDEKAQLLAREVEDYPLYAPEPGWSEQDPADWWAGAQTVLKRLTAKLEGKHIAGLGLSGQMHGMVALDADDAVLRRAILWNDQRTEAQCEEIITKAGGPDGLLLYTNNSMLTGFTGGKILWFREKEPELFARTRQILNPKDYLNFKLTGVHGTERSDASGTGLFDVKENRWSTELLGLLGLSVELFAEVHASTDVIGAVTAEAASKTGLPAGTPVVAGGGDAVLSAVGMGLGGEKQVAVTLGTSGVVARHLPAFFSNDGAKVQFSRACLPGKFHVMGVTLSAAGAYSWLETLLGDVQRSSRKERFRALDTEAALSPPGANGVLFLPYLSGERCPVNDATATGSFTGLRLQTTRGDLIRAVLEGVAFSLREAYDLMSQATGAAEQLILAGGGAVSPLWRQIISEVFAIPAITLEAGEEGGSFGAAILAGLGTGAWGSAEEILGALQIKTTTTPDPEHVKVYQARYEQYKKIYPAQNQA